MKLKNLLYNIFKNIIGWGFILFSIIMLCLKNEYAVQIGFIIFSILIFFLMAFKLFLLKT